MRRWKRKGRTYRFNCKEAQSIIFGSELPMAMWAWGVWASKFSAEGIEWSLARAKQRTNEALDKAIQASEEKIA